MRSAKARIGVIYTHTWFTNAHLNQSVGDCAHTLLRSVHFALHYVDRTTNSNQAIPTNENLGSRIVRVVAIH
jgi:hypothetical protein